MLRCGDQVRLTKREVELLAQRVRFVPEGIRTENDLRCWFAKVRLYYTSFYGEGTELDLMARRRLDQELSKLLMAA